MRIAYGCAAIGLALGLVACAPARQGPPGQHADGTIKSVTAQDLVLATSMGDMDLALTAKTRVMRRVPASVGEIKQGAYLGSANRNSANGGSATEVHLMDNGPNVNFPMDDNGLMMTNGHVTSVKTTPAGQEIDVDYGQGATRHIVIPAGTKTTRLVDASAADLKPSVNITAYYGPAENGRYGAQYLTIEPPAGG